MPKPFRILWSVDAFQPNSEQAQLFRPLADFVGRLAEQIANAEDRRVEIEPVHVLSPDQINLELSFSLQWLKPYRPAAERALQSVLKEVKVGPTATLLPPQVLLQPKPKRQVSTQTLAKYARAEKFDLIIIGTHARRGLRRLMLGSFTESLLLQAETPVLAINPETAIPARIEKVVLGMDLSAGAKHVESKAFDSALRFAKSVGAELVLYHAIQNPLEPVFQSSVYLLSGSTPTPLPDLVDRELQKRKLMAERFVAKAQKQKIRARAVVERVHQGVVSGLLQCASSENASLIAVASHTGPLAAQLMGSIARQVVRETHLPVWVVRNSKRS